MSNDQLVKDLCRVNNCRERESEMIEKLLKKIALRMIEFIVAMLTPEQIQAALSRAFDAIEKEIKNSNAEWDDVLALPVLQALRKAIGVDDTKTPE